ncbi:MAG: outer membrane protein transport protein [Ignavibacteria bacterium]|nr:outer membrane protein transport protein [Ignavibacteria bacterium]
MNFRKQVIAFIILINFTSLFAGGFQINEHGARAMAMGGAFTAVAFDPSAVYFNSAAITRLDGVQIMVGTTMIAPNASFRGPYGPTVSNPTLNESKMPKQVFFPSHGYVTYKYSDNLSFGLGFNDPFGLGTKWDDSWAGRFVSTEADVKTYSINPVVAYKPFSTLAVSAGFQYNWGTVTLMRYTPIPTYNPSLPVATIGEGHVTLDGKDNAAYGYTASLLYQPTKEFSFGVQFRSKSTYEFTGTQKVDSKVIAVADKDIKATLVTPQQITFGVGYQVNEALILDADFQYIGWTSYDTLKVEYTNSTDAPLATAREYKDTWIFRIGGDYKYDKDWSFQLGFLYDRNPVPDNRVDASLPDSDRLGFSVGFSHNLTENLSAQFSYLFLHFKERTISNSDVQSFDGKSYAPEKFNGTYNFTANLVSFSLYYHL